MRRLVLLFLLAAVSLAGVGVMGAYFTGQAQVSENVIRGGAVHLSTEPTSSALSIDALAPGLTVVKPLTVVNDGNLAESVVVTGAKKAGITEFYNALNVLVTMDGQTLYDGALSAMRTAPFTLAPGARAQLQFAIGLPAEAGNELAEDYVKLTLYLDAEQAH